MLTISSPWVGLVLLAVAALAVPVSRRLTGDFFSPPALIAAAWSATLGLYFLHLMPYPPLAVRTVLLVAGTVALMVAGASLGARLAQRSGEARPPAPAAGRAIDAWVVTMSVLGLVGVAWYIVSVVRILGAGAFATGAVIRRALGTGELPSRYLFLQFFCLTAPMVALAASLAGQRLRRYSWVAVVACALATWITTDRTQFFLLVITGFFLYVFRRGPGLSWARMIGVGSVCAAMLVANFVIVGAWVGKTPTNLRVTMQMPAAPPEQVEPIAEPRPAPPPAASPPQASAQSASAPPKHTRPAGSPRTTRPPATPPAASPAPPSVGPASAPPPGGMAPTPAVGPTPPAAPSRLSALLQRWLQRSSTIYLYATGSYPALDGLLAESQTRTHGVHVVYPIARFLERARLIAGPLPPAIPPHRSLAMTSGSDVQYNAYTFLYYPWMDFGTVGALIYAAGIGVLSGLVYGALRRNRRSPIRLLLMAQVATALLLSVFVCKFNNTASWYILAFTLLPFVAGWRRGGAAGNVGPA